MAITNVVFAVTPFMTISRVLIYYIPVHFLFYLFIQAIEFFQFVIAESLVYLSFRGDKCVSF
jgi:hypothetical protein